MDARQTLGELVAKEKIPELLGAYLHDVHAKYGNAIFEELISRSTANVSIDPLKSGRLFFNTDDGVGHKLEFSQHISDTTLVSDDLMEQIIMKMRNSPNDHTELFNELMQGLAKNEVFQYIEHQYNQAHPQADQQVFRNFVLRAAAFKILSIATERYSQKEFPNATDNKKVADRAEQDEYVRFVKQVQKPAIEETKTYLSPTKYSSEEGARVPPYSDENNLQGNVLQILMSRAVNSEGVSLVDMFIDHLYEVRKKSAGTIIPIVDGKDCEPIDVNYFDLFVMAEGRNGGHPMKQEKYRMTPDGNPLEYKNSRGGRLFQIPQTGTASNEDGKNVRLVSGERRYDQPEHFDAWIKDFNMQGLVDEAFKQWMDAGRGSVKNKIITDLGEMIVKHPRFQEWINGFKHDFQHRLPGNREGNIIDDGDLPLLVNAVVGSLLYKVIGNIFDKRAAELNQQGDVKAAQQMYKENGVLASAGNGVAYDYDANLAARAETRVQQETLSKAAQKKQAAPAVSQKTNKSDQAKPEEVNVQKLTTFGGKAVKTKPVKAASDSTKDAAKPKQPKHAKSDPTNTRSPGGIFGALGVKAKGVKADLESAKPQSASVVVVGKGELVNKMTKDEYNAKLAAREEREREEKAREAFKKGEMPSAVGAKDGDQEKGKDNSGYNWTTPGNKK